MDTAAGAATSENRSGRDKLQIEMEMESVTALYQRRLPMLKQLRR